ncbi:MAG: Glucosidase YgjK [Bacteroides rodentium]
MKQLKKNILLPCMALGVVASCAGTPDTPAETLLSKQADFYNLIDIKNTPKGAIDWDAYVFADKGAWMGYSLPDNETYRQHGGAFMGPMTMTGRGWIAAGLAEPTLMVNGQKWDMLRNVQTTKYLPGRLVQEYNDEHLNFTTELCFISPRSVAIRSAVKNVSGKPLTVDFTWNGGVYEPTTQSSLIDKGISFVRPKDEVNTVVRFLTADKVEAIHNDSLRATEKTALTLEPGKVYQSAMTQTMMLRGEDTAKELEAIALLDIDNCFEQNETQWNKQIASLLSGSSKYLNDNKYRKVMVKAMMTLNSNYRTPAGDILHGGSNPSYNGFINGIWSWDSWKIASANVLFNPEIAKEEMLTLFDYQAENGMVPDFIGYNKLRNNWRDAKPPVAAWGAMNVYKATGDKQFLEAIFDKLYKFHRWWYAERDHNHNGICEYGSTDGTLIAACWESGMDNGVRFDDAVMLQHGEKAWSMNQENICLNSFLYVDKLALAEMATILGRTELTDQLKNEAEVIKQFVQNKMWDSETGFFYDTRIDTGEHIKVMGAECWLPLWAGIATPEQAKLVMEKMMDPNKFNSTVPLGTLDVSHPRLRPTRGYWRGPVWVDQVYFGITGLRNYGFDREADMLTEKFIDNAQGLTTNGPIHENYNPLTGEVLNSPNFGWSSACIIKMLLEE